MEPSEGDSVPLRPDPGPDRQAGGQEPPLAQREEPGGGSRGEFSQISHSCSLPLRSSLFHVRRMDKSLGRFVG